MLFSKKCLQNHPPFLLHFLVHIDVLMLCRKFELIPTKIFQVTAILKNEPISEKSPVLLYMYVFSLFSFPSFSFPLLFLSSYSYRFYEESLMLMIKMD